MDKHKHFFFVSQQFSNCICATETNNTFSVHFTGHFAWIRKKAIKLCCLLYFWPIHLPIFIPCLVLFKFYYCFMKALPLTIPIDKTSFLIHNHLKMSSEITCICLWEVIGKKYNAKISDEHLIISVCFLHLLLIFCSFQCKQVSTVCVKAIIK